MSESPSPRLMEQIKTLAAVSVIILGLLVVVSLLGTSLHVAANIAVGALICLVHMGFYAVIVGFMFVKKHIAWAGPVIVIKYLILILSVYLVWAYLDVLIVLIGLFSELLLTTTVYGLLLLKRQKRKNANGPL